MWYISGTLAKIWHRKEIMEKYENIHAIVNEIGTIVFRYKNKDITQDDECRQIYTELQAVCDKYRIKVGEQEGLLAVKLSDLFLKYLCGIDLGEEYNE